MEEKAQQNLQESSYAQGFKDLKWSLDLQHFYLRKTLITIREYKEKIAKMKEVSEGFAQTANNLKKSVNGYSIE